jgi:hypothetical protein
MGDSQIAAALRRRGIFTPATIGANIHCNNHCIYIPVYEKGDMVQYVGRFIDRKNENNIFNLSDPKSRRYDYISGIPITQYLYDWDRLRLARELTLVENTFNAIHYTQNFFHCTSTFGSHLSTRQIDLIKHSRAKTVVFLWDEGANYTQAVRQLRREGVTAAAVKVHGQPDDHPSNKVANCVLELHERLRSGTFDGNLSFSPELC